MLSTTRCQDPCLRALINGGFLSKNSCLPEKPIITNLSSTPLSDHQTSLVCLGPSYRVSEPCFPLLKMVTSFQYLINSLDTKSSTQGTTLSVAASALIRRLSQHPPKSNLSNANWHSLNLLKRNKQLSILCYDKGKGFALMPTCARPGFEPRPTYVRNNCIPYPIDGIGEVITVYLFGEKIVKRIVHGRDLNLDLCTYVTTAYPTVIWDGRSDYGIPFWGKNHKTKRTRPGFEP